MKLFYLETNIQIKIPQLVKKPVYFKIKINLGFFNDRSCQRHLAIVRWSGLVPTSRPFSRISASAFGRPRAKPSFLRVRFHSRIAALPPVESLHLSHLKKVFEQQTL